MTLVAASRTGLAEGLVDAFGDPDSLPDFPPTFETLTQAVLFGEEIVATVPPDH